MKAPCKSVVSWFGKRETTLVFVSWSFRETKMAKRRNDFGGNPLWCNGKRHRFGETSFAKSGQSSLVSFRPPSLRGRNETTSL